MKKILIIVGAALIGMIVIGIIVFMVISKSGEEKEIVYNEYTLDEYYSFIDEYPESKYSREVRKIYDDTAKFLKLDNSNNLVNVQ